jgi:hypothetical protein
MNGLMENGVKRMSKNILIGLLFSFIALFCISLGTIIDRNRELNTIYDTLSQRCELPSHFERATLSCVVTYMEGN